MRKPVRTLTLLLAVLLGACNDAPPDVVGGPTAMRRLTPEQYRNAVEDAFGSAVTVAGRFEPELRREGLNALGAAQVSISPSGFEQYEAIARNIARQVVSEDLRAEILPCQPARPDAADAACTGEVVGRFGRSLLRRPLTPGEIERRVAAAGAVADARQDYYAGLELALASLLVSPEFLFRVERAEPAPTGAHPARLALTDLTLASRLSYFLWNRGPDAALLASAERGELRDPDVLAQEVERMLASPRLADGVRAFFADLFMFDAFDDLAKDVARYPLYSDAMARDAREQTLRFVVGHLVDRQADYRELYTSRALPMTRSLGPVYALPVHVAAGWEDTTLPRDHPRAGLLSHASFSMLHAHPGRSSPTLRGVFMREALLCQVVPEAPADVDFTQFSSTEAGDHQTARERLAVHNTEASCRGCHQITDPIGLGLEVFDGIGRYRTTENGAPIDTSGEFDGTAFAGPAELGQALAAHDRLPACLTQTLYRYAVGREQTAPERRLLRYLEQRFEAAGYRLPALMRDIATSEGFRTASDPGAAGAPTQTAAKPPASRAQEEEPS